MLPPPLPALLDLPSSACPLGYAAKEYHLQQEREVFRIVNRVQLRVSCGSSFKLVDF